jgi:hypothetical protein
VDVTHRRAERRGEVVALAHLGGGEPIPDRLPGPGLVLIRDKQDGLLLLVVGPEARVREQLRMATGAVPLHGIELNPEATAIY